MDLLSVRHALAKLERLTRSERDNIEGFAELKPYLYKLAYVAETRRKLVKHTKAKLSRLQHEIQQLRTAAHKPQPRTKTKKTTTPPPKKKPNVSRKKCYMCRQPHVLFQTDTEDKICPTCVQLNTTMRTRPTDVQGKYVLITGGRIKVGYHTALAFLRGGANVMVTTRFPKDALRRYQAETDTQTWIGNLRIVAADFTRMRDIEQVIEAVQNWTTRLDILVNNAAQTIRRPRAFYHSLLQQETPLLLGKDNEAPNTIVAYRAQERSLGISMALDDAYTPQDTVTFPTGRVDIDGQQLDLRRENTWTQGIRDTDTVECLETMIVNSVAPFHLVKMLLPLMKRDAMLPHAWILNITSAEGRFDKKAGKAKHPHNNMSKAAFNMLTKTIATDVSHDRVIITSIDIGWVNNMGPGDQLGNGMALLSYADAVARIMHPLGEPDARAFNGNLVRHFVVRNIW